MNILSKKVDLCGTIVALVFHVSVIIVFAFRLVGSYRLGIVHCSKKGNRHVAWRCYEDYERF